MLRSFVCQYRSSDGQLKEYAVPALSFEQAHADAVATLDDPESIVTIYEDPDEFDFLLKEVMPDAHHVCAVCGTPYAASADVGCTA
jgi:hypothetical protein